jgi:hypothetical protein
MAEIWFTNSLFEESYWLDCVCPGNWSYITVEQNSDIVGRMPIYMKNKFSFKSVSLPKFTPWLGPWISKEVGGEKNYLNRQHEVLRDIIRQVPFADRTLISCAPEYKNLMAFHWAGYKLGLAYTYRINDLSDPDRIWHNMRDKTRNVCRKASKLLVVNEDRSIHDVIPLLIRTLARKGIDYTDHCKTLLRIDDLMRKRNQRKIYAAEDKDGKVYAFCYIVHDSRHSFYIAGGAEPSLRESGGQTLVLWHAIANAREISKIFDFEGSMVAPIEHFFNGFGADQTPRFYAEKQTFSYALINSIRALR